MSNSYSITEARPIAIVVHCSDPRFQQAFARFIHGDLQLQDGEFIPLVISGGVGSLAEPLRLPKEFKFMKERIETFLDRFDSINRIILMNHEDCRHYELLQSMVGKLFLRAFPAITDRQKGDLKAVAKALQLLTSRRIELKLYFARFEDAGRARVVFEEILA